MAEIVRAWLDAIERSKGTITRCPKCNRPLRRRPGQFFWRGTHSDGAVCDRCNALWSIVGEEMEPLKAPSDK